MFLWMFIEGIILYHMTTVAYSRGPENRISFYFCGWCKYKHYITTKCFGIKWKNEIFIDFLVKRFLNKGDLKSDFLLMHHFYYHNNLVLPIPLTVAWLITKAHESDADTTSCGSGYSFLPSYWILEGPRLTVILVRYIWRLL